MAAPFSTSHRAQIHYQTWPTKPPKTTKPQKPYKNLYFLSTPSLTTTIPTTSSHSLSTTNPSLSPSPFPLSNTKPLPFYPLHDSTDEHLLENPVKPHPNLENLIKFDVPTIRNHRIAHQELKDRIFIQDPPWISSLFLKGLHNVADYKGLRLEFKDIEKKKYNLLRRRQIKEETEAWERMVDEYKGLVREMCEKKLAPNLPYVKGLFLGWFEPLKEAIEKEQKLQKSKSKKQKAAFAPHIELLPADKMAVIVMHKMMGLVMLAQDDGCVQVVQAAVQIGMAIEHEVSMEVNVSGF